MSIALGKAEYDVVSVNRAKRLAIADDDQILRVVTFFDIDGEETETDAEAVVAVASHPGGTYCVIDLTQFDEAEVH